MANENGKVAGVYPEVGAGGFSRVDGTVDFYARINALIRPEMRVLDLGAGRGAQLEKTDVPYRVNLQKLRGKVAELVGVDVDEAVLENRFMDKTVVVGLEESLPFADSSFDLVYADWVLEHVSEPDRFVREVKRLLKPGGWFCARTPNYWGMTAVGARLVPESAHAAVLKKLQPGRQERDIFPKVYKLNTQRAIRRFFSRDEWDNFSYMHYSGPQYVEWSPVLMKVVNLAFRFLPGALYTNVHIFLRKK